MRRTLISLLLVLLPTVAFAQDTRTLGRSVLDEVRQESYNYETGVILATAQQGPASLTPTNARFTTLNCNGSTGTSGQVLVGGNPCTWTGSPSITKLLVADGTAALPSQTFANAAGTGLYQSGGSLRIAASGNAVGRWDTSGIDLLSDTERFSLGASVDVVLARDAANTLALKNGTNVQTFRVYDASGAAFTAVRGDGFVTNPAAVAVANVGANSCGTTAATIAGGNNAFVITVGATSGSQCRVAFTFAATTEWDCAANDDTTTVAVRTTPVDTTHTDLIGAFTAGDRVTGICFPR